MSRSTDRKIGLSRRGRTCQAPCPIWADGATTLLLLPAAHECGMRVSRVAFSNCKGYCTICYHRPAAYQDMLHVTSPNVDATSVVTGVLGPEDAAVTSCDDTGGIPDVVGWPWSPV